MVSDIANGFTNAVGTAGNLLQGAAKDQLKNNQLNNEVTSSGIKYIQDASGKAIDFMTQANQQKANLMAKQMQQEALAERQKVAIAAKQTDQTQKQDAEKAKFDYENFTTVTPEIADGLYKSSGGKLDFRRTVGQRIQTKVLIPLAQIFSRQKTAEDKPSSNSKDLNALKTFTSEYDKRKKDFDDPLKASMASRNPQMQARRSKDEKWLKDNEGKYNEATQKVGKIGGLSDDNQDDTVTPPATSSSDIDALIDQAFK